MVHHPAKLEIVAQPGERLATSSDRARQQILQRFSLYVFLSPPADLQPVRDLKEDRGEIRRGKR
jgi:hypothetical protein